MRYEDKKAKAAAGAREKDARITARDLLNSFACAYDPIIRSKAEKTLRNALSQIRESVLERAPITLYVDGSYNPDSGAAGIGIIIIPDLSDPRPGSPGNVIFGKSVKAKSALEAEIYALSVGLSYILDTFPDAGYIYLKYDSVDSTACATNIESLAQLGAPYTNFKSALKRVKKKKINVAFEHVKAHENDPQNERCDLIAKYYSKAALSAPQLKIAKRLLKKDGAAGKKEDKRNADKN